MLRERLDYFSRSFSKGKNEFVMSAIKKRTSNDKKEAASMSRLLPFFSLLLSSPS